jgi:hypothetical protein
MITSAIEQSAANKTLASEALKEASNEVAQIQTLLSQVQSQIQAQSPSSEYKNNLIFFSISNRYLSQTGLFRAIGVLI